MFACAVISVAAGLVLFFANTALSESQRRSSHGVVAKAGPAFSWLKKLDRDELVAVGEQCQQGAAALQANESAHHHSLERIIGGELATRGQFPYAVALGRASTYVATCGATLISSRHLLTAAHCVTTDMSKDEAILNRTVWIGGVCYFNSTEDNCPTPDMLEVEMELVVKVYYSYSVRDTRGWDEKSYSVNASDWSEPYVRRILGESVSVQYHLDDLCYFLQLGCGVEGVTGVATTLRLSSFYLKRKRSEMPSIVPFALLSDEEPIASHAAPEKAVAALVVAGNGGGKEQVICVAVAISPRHLVTPRACIIMDKYLRDWRGQTTGGGIIAVTGCDTNSPSQQCTNRVEFIAWQRAVTTQAHGQQALAGSELAIVQLASTDNNRL